MKRFTPTVILGVIAVIFGIDTALSLGDHATISEWTYNFLHADPVLGFSILIGFFAVLIAHFWWFRPKE